MIRRVTGTIRTHAGESMPGEVVQAFNQRSLDEVTLLGEAISDRAGRYSIPFEFEPPRDPRLRRLNLVVRVFDRDGNLIGDSELLPDAPAEAQIDVTVNPDGRGTESDYDRLTAALAPWYKDNLRLLRDEQAATLATLSRSDAGLIITLRRADRVARGVTLDREAVFGALRLGLEPDEDGLFEPEPFADAVSRAVDAGIIAPAVRRQLGRLQQTLQERWDARRLRRRPKTVSRQVVGRLVDEATGTALVGFTVHGENLGVDPPEALGHDISDGEGRFGFFLGIPAAEEAAGPVERTLRLQVEAPDGETIHEQDVSARVDAADVVEVRIPPPAPEPSPSPLIEESGLDLPEDLTTFLRERSIRTLADLRRAGGPDALDGLPLPSDAPVVRTLAAYARLDVVSPDLEVTRALASAGFADPAAAARAPRTRVVGPTHERVGDVRAVEVQVAARAWTAVARNLVTSLQVELTNGVETGVSEGILRAAKKNKRGTLPTAHCGCEDCKSAVSPLAYLADLLDYALDHLEDAGKPLTLGRLEALFFQPFGKLPVSCAEMDRKVRQVRLAIEVLRRYLAARHAPASNSAAAAALEAAERAYAQSAYTTLLTHAGTSYEEVRLARTADEAFHQTLADRLGIALEHLNSLFLDANAEPAEVTEEALESLFGLVATTRDPLAKGTEPQLLAWRRAHLRTRWHAEDWPEASEGEALVPVEGLQPLIDPDLIGPADLATPKSGSVAFELWQARRDWVDGRLAALKSQREAASSALEGMDEVIDAALAATGQTVADLLALHDLIEAGEDIAEPLDTLRLPRAAFKRLLAIRTLVEQDQPVIDAEWEEVDSILVQLEKRHQVEAWRAEELAAGLILGPEAFRPRKPKELTFPPPALPSLPHWRADARDRRDWEDRLTARIDQEQAVTTALNEGVSAAEEAALPQLRDTLIQGVGGLKVRGVAARAKWLGDHLLIDMQAGGCQQTTRIAQGIETVQSLLWSVRNRLLNDTHPDLELNDDDFDDVWKWLGSYATWRAAMFVFLYPENVLDPSLRRYQSPAFRHLVETLGADRRLDPEQARRAAEHYDDYFRDVSSLTPEACCQTRTRQYEGGTARGYAYRFFTFARGGRTGRVYWSHIDAGDATGHAQSFWTEVPGLTDVTQIIGAAPYRRSSNDGYVYLFCRVVEKGQQKLQFVRYDLETARWEAEPFELDLPEEGAAFEALVRHRFRENVPPELLVRMKSSGPGGSVFRNRLAWSGEEWREEGWELLLDADALGNAGLRAFLETGDQQACLVTSGPYNRIFYRYFGTYDDGLAHLGAIGELVGAFAIPGTNEIVLAYRIGTVAFYVRVAPSAREYREVGDIIPAPADLRILSLHLWLIRAVGADLTTISPEGGSFKTLRLYDIFAADFWKHQSIFPGWTVDSVRSRFASWLEDTAQASEYTDPVFGVWRRAVDRVAALGEPPAGETRLNLEEALIFINREEPVRFLHRASDRMEVSPALQGMVRILPVSGVVEDESSQRLFCFQSYKGIYRCQRSGLKLPGDPAGRALPPQRMAPNVSTAFVATDGLSEQQLQVRRGKVKTQLLDHRNDPRSTLTYLEEAYYFLPVLLALRLQTRGHYTASLDWWRAVYDYSMPGGERKIYYGLEEAWTETYAFERAEDWLLDPLNPHEIAASRQNSYTRYTLLAVTRCMLDYADADFTLDTAESVPRARLLYLTALELLQDPVLKQSTRRCSDIAGTLDIQVGDPHWRPVLGRLQVELSRISDAQRMEAAVRKVETALEGSGTQAERFAAAEQEVVAALAESRSHSSLSELMEERAERSLGLLDIVSVDGPSATVLARAATQATERFRQGVSLASGISVEVLGEEAVSLPALRSKMSVGVGVSPNGAGTVPVEREKLRRDYQELTRSPALAPSRGTVLANLAQGNLVAAVQGISIKPGYVPAPSFVFCIPHNPVLKALRLRAELNLYKLRTCRNIAGMQRTLEPYAAPTDTVSGLPTIGAGGQLVLPGLQVMKPTPYRYPVLVERARQLTGLAQQVEAALLAAIEKGEAEQYSLLRARQDVQMARGGVQLQRLRLREAEGQVVLAELQQARSQIQVEQYQQWLDEGTSTWELLALAQMHLAMADYIADAAVSWSLSSAASAKSALGSIFSTMASYERREQEWAFQRRLAQQDVLIGGQQVKLAEDHVRVVEQERVISEMQLDCAHNVVDFLASKFTNAELYDWMGRVLEGVYSFFLQQATAMAQLAQQQLAFERQETAPPFIQPDYWEAPADYLTGGTDGKAPDRRGLTGSVRLLRDIEQLDQFAFDTNRRKLQLTRTISLARLAPAEFQRFRETGQLTFATPMELFDRDFPGHYLRLIRRVRTSVIALIPPTDGIHATLSTTGTSRVVIGGDLFQKVIVNHGPQSVALTSPRDATGLFELEAQPAEMLLPFEGLGVDTTWELRMPRAANFFDYSTIADVLLTIEYTALDSFVYRQQVIQDLGDTISADRPFSFRHQFADAWYDLHNPDQTATPMVVRFQTRRADFPPNLANLKVQHVVLYFARKEGTIFEIPVDHLLFTERNGIGSVGGGATSIDGIVSTRKGNAASWTAMLGKAPVGEWELALANMGAMKSRFTDEEIEDILLVITYRGTTPPWPK